MSFGAEVKRLREAKPLTQQQLADMIGVNQSFVAKLERGTATRFGADTLYRLCDALGVGCEHFRPFLAEPPEQDDLGPPDRPQGKRK
jgi:transcriptional regulator with XRE-family HTH domain